MSHGLTHKTFALLLLQLENWVFESDKPDAELKLIDFGLSTYFGKVCCGCCGPYANSACVESALDGRIRVGARVHLFSMA